MSLPAPEHAAAILTFDTVYFGGLYLQAVYNAAGAKLTHFGSCSTIHSWFN